MSGNWRLLVATASSSFIYLPPLSPSVRSAIFLLVVCNHHFHIVFNGSMGWKVKFTWWRRGHFTSKIGQWCRRQFNFTASQRMRKLCAVTWLSFKTSRAESPPICCSSPLMAALKILSSQSVPCTTITTLFFLLCLLYSPSLSILGCPSPLSGNSQLGTRINYRYISPFEGACYTKSGKMLPG